MPSSNRSQVAASSTEEALDPNLAERIQVSQLNLTSSIFHNVTLDHLKHIPFYRISTPKAPIYQVEEERGRFSAFGSKRRDKGISTQSANSSPSV
jgi:hypothetical protein